eukprot:COSAG01_NODE_4713_length_4797_cov_84.010856_7_plen_73_part_00
MYSARSSSSVGASRWMTCHGHHERQARQPIDIIICYRDLLLVSLLLLLFVYTCMRVASQWDTQSAHGRVIKH